MTSRIQLLPDEVISLIAAGEVIDSPAAVVRELAENALDAGATRLTIQLWPEQWRIRVTDNGLGMGWGDLEQAALPHSTSKIRSSEDLWQIASLGFRGEALHSLSQLAQLTICSRPPTEDATGWRVTYDPQGHVAEAEAIAIAPGTIITVDQLFACWPARQQSLPSIPQQLRAVQTVVQRLALCHPQITWQVSWNDRAWFTLWPGSSAHQILPQCVRGLTLSDLRSLSIDLEDPDPTGTHLPLSQVMNHLEMVMGLPDRCHRRRPDWVQVGINGRPVQMPELESTILTRFRRTLPRDRFPVCFLHLQVSPEYIDWNRHPAKSEIYLRYISYWQEQVTQAIDQILRLSSDSVSTSAQQSRTSQVLKAAETEATYTHRQIVAGGLSSEGDSPGLSGTRLVAIAQIHNRYILAEQPSGVCLIEQHIAHERVIYEQLCDRWQLVALPSPIILSQITPAQVEQLQRLTLEVDSFGEDLWAVRSAPQALAQREDCADALLELSLGGDLQTAIVATACRAAIRNGTPLSLAEMQTLLDQWQQTRNPHTCPHGRPICLTLEETSLARFFRRHWVIGKSHGI